MKTLLWAFCLSTGFVGVASAADSLHFRLVGSSLFHVGKLKSSLPAMR